LFGYSVSSPHSKLAQRGVNEIPRGNKDRENRSERERERERFIKESASLQRGTDMLKLKKGGESVSIQNNSEQQRLSMGGLMRRKSVEKLNMNSNLLFDQASPEFYYSVS
jgi:hypothetical protein